MFADYRVVRPLWSANHGDFYLARPPARLGIDDRLVEIKVFAGSCSEAAFRRGTRELRAFAAVNSPHIAVVHDAVLQGEFLYAMEHFPLGSLARPAGPVSRNDVLLAVEHAARAVDALHHSGLSHGDVNPGNVMLYASGGKLADLSLTRPLARAGTLTSMAPPSSLGFLDPELLLGAEPSRASDIWALAATLHRALSGTGLYPHLPDQQSILAIRRIQTGTPVISPTLTESERRLVRDCFDRQLSTAGELAERLAALRHD